MTRIEQLARFVTKASYGDLSKTARQQLKIGKDGRELTKGKQDYEELSRSSQTELTQLLSQIKEGIPHGQ